VPPSRSQPLLRTPLYIRLRGLKQVVKAKAAAGEGRRFGL
jgi:hypothetical protein